MLATAGFWPTSASRPAACSRPGPPKSCFQLADRYARSGRWELAAECFATVAERYRDQPLAVPALVWLVQYYASGEAAWRNRASQQLTVEQTTSDPAALAAAIAGASGGVRTAGGESARPQT